MELDLKELLLETITAAYNAGIAILEIYDSDFSVEHKEDNSPLTLADKKSNDVITGHLSNISKKYNIPVLSEEGKGIPFDERKKWEYFWLIDPLDGTKEFIKRNGEFTVNIALIKDSRPALGIVYVPVKDIFYFAAADIGAYRLDMAANKINGEALARYSLDDILQKSDKLPILKTPAESSGLTIVASRSHMNQETEEFIGKLKKEHDNVELVSAGSSIKLCLVAEGSAHIYPRLAPTMEWDTAAAHAVVNGAGKKVLQHNKNDELIYNKPELKNPWFVVK